MKGLLRGSATVRRRRACAALVAALAGGWLLAGCGGSSGSVQSITLYNGQHEQTTDSLVSAFEKATGITVNIRSDDEDTLADELVTEGSRSPADVVYTENSPALEYLQSKGLLAAVDPSTLGATSSQYNSPQGDWVGVSARVSVLIYNPSMISASQLPDLGPPARRSPLSGRAGFRRRRDRLPADRHLGRARLRVAGDAHLAGGDQGQRRQPRLPRQRDHRRRGQPGRVAFGVVNQYYWYRMRAELGASNVHSTIAYFAPFDPGYVLDVSGAAVLHLRTHQAAAQKFLAFLISTQGQQIIAHSISFEYPIASGVTTAQPETPFDELQPNSITIPELGDGPEAISLLQQAGLL